MPETLPESNVTKHHKEMAKTKINNHVRPQNLVLNKLLLKIRSLIRTLSQYLIFQRLFFMISVLSHFIILIL